MGTAPAGPERSCCDAARSEAMTRYLRVIYLMSFRAAHVSMSEIAARLGVATPSVSAMLRRLEGAGLLAASGAGGVVLSEHGERHAREVVRRHRLIESFLVQAAGMSWDEVHADAERLQYVVSDLLISRIDAVLDHPRFDPHGDPIPQPASEYTEDWPPALADAPDGASFRVERVSDDDSAALRHLASLGVGPGVVLRVAEREPFGGPLWIEAGGQRRALGSGLTGLVHGTVLDGPVLDGPVLDGPVLDGPVPDGPVPGPAVPT